ncbi:PTS sugar transporter subunit IIB [Staphylococcus lutrae]|uniref:PTS sugar transporter subunit IIB n=1 Tax=Staphylococcus lutrae TaxID=155085 RepID=A0AAC9WKR5_9STAP|nr:PTS sugar transporter subunit IIB [Staphylococcus lutrae]PNZ34230.1 PTS sugar transporter subunit IIB [Staphylococcus lutrae]
MKTILLACAAGMSTSMLVQRMEKASQNFEGEFKIYAVSVAEVEREIEQNTIDIVLLGPQVRYEEGKLKAKLEPIGIPLRVIDMSDYGLMDGQAVMEKAIEIIG